MDLLSAHKLRRLYNFRNRLRLKNHDFSLIASNCVGGCILHDLGLPFNSPFVNVYLMPSDFLRFCERMGHYLDEDLGFTRMDGINYPLGVLDDIMLHFMHYSSEQETKDAWDRRKERINMDNLFVMFTDRDGCTHDDLLRFDRLNLRNKVVFTHVEHKDIASAFYIPGFENEGSVGQLMDFRSRFSYKKYYDAFDYVSWFNGNLTANDASFD